MKINVDAGHGTNTAGKRTPPLPTDIKSGSISLKKGEQYREHYANVGVTILLVKELKRCGFETMQTGFNDADPGNDVDTSLADRQKAIAAGKCDISISIHFNASGDGSSFNSGEGIGVFVHDKNYIQSDKLAPVVLKHLAGGTSQKNRGVTKSALAMCNCAAMKTKAAILCELAFMTNLHETTTMMMNEDYWLECAQEIAKGICEYTGTKYIEDMVLPATITPASSAKEIKWVQEKLNAVLSEIPGITPLEVNGVYGPNLRIAVLLYWQQLGWANLKDHGTSIGKTTINALAAGRKK
ncbi:MAG: hypothetical protein K0R00_884 [Herbinix sp.]|jgi:N-acetylmuramoyl-L-alanine amidase|nr:hypothetical protein [Herbinix sp.]